MLFRSSPRPGTPAARMPQVDKAVIRQRAAELRDDVANVRNRWLNGLVGTVQEVLTEADGTGYSPAFARVALPAGTPRGTIVSVTPISATQGLLQ